MVELKNVNVHYSSGVDALQNINLRINDGEFVFIVGGSGAGKSTLVKLMTREIVPTEGRVFVNGYNLSKTKGNKIAKFRRSIGMVFQDFRLIQELNVYENVAFVLRIADQSTRFIKQRVPNVLNLVGLGNKARSKPRELSGGEQQRVAIARALANDPGLIIADEPTGNIDPETSYRLVELLKDICDSGKTVVIATHQYDLIKHFPGKVFRCENGTLQEDFSFIENLAEMNAMSNEDVKDTAIDVSNSPTTIPEEQLATEQEVIPLEDENSEIFVPTELVPEEVQKIVVITEKTEMLESPTMLAEDITINLENTEENITSQPE